MSIVLHAAVGVALLAAGAYAGYRDHEIVCLFLLFAGMVVMGLFRDRVLATARSRGDRASGSAGKADGS